jgi:hypothetical protein
MRDIRKISILLVSLAGSYVSTANASSVSPIVGYIGTYSSNILLTPDNEEWEWVNRPLIGFDVDHRGKNLNAYGYATAQYFDFTQGSAENETYYDVNGIAEWNIIGDRLQWILEDYASVAPLVISDPVTPFNVEQQNILSTGPTMRTRLGTRNQFDWSLRYQNFYYSISDIGNYRLSSDLGVARQVSHTDSVRIGYMYTTTRYQEEIYADYSRQDIGVSYTHTGVSARINVGGGYSYLEDESQSESVEGGFAIVDSSVRISPRSTMSLLASSRLSDAGDASYGVGVAEVEPGVVVEPSNAFAGSIQAPNTDIFRLNELTFGLVNRQPVLTSTFGLGYSQANYITDETQDNRNIYTDLRFDYPIRSITLLSAYLSAGRQEYPNQLISNNDSLINDNGSLGLSMGWRVFRRVNMVFDVSRNIQKSNDPARSYTETLANVRLIYRPSGRETAVRAVRRGR